MRELCVLLLIAVLVTACRGTAREDAFHLGPWTFEEVQERSWRLVQLDGQGISSDERPILSFEADGALNGNAGVNSFFGTWQRSGETGIVFANLGSTRRAGAPELMQQEARFLASLATIDSWRVVGEMLQLRRADVVALAFVPAAD